MKKNLKYFIPCHLWVITCYLCLVSEKQQIGYRALITPCFCGLMSEKQLADQTYQDKLDGSKVQKN